MLEGKVTYQKYWETETRAVINSFKTLTLLEARNCRWWIPQKVKGMGRGNGWFWWGHPGKFLMLGKQQMKCKGKWKRNCNWEASKKDDNSCINDTYIRTTETPAQRIVVQNSFSDEGEVAFAQDKWRVLQKENSHMLQLWKKRLLCFYMSRQRGNTISACSNYEPSVITIYSARHHQALWGKIRFFWTVKHS